MSETCKCISCEQKGFRLHEGDRVVFTSGFPAELFRELNEVSLARAIWIQGQVTKQTDLVVQANPAESSRTVEKAKAFNVPFTATRSFRILLNDVAPNGRHIHNLKQPSRSDLVSKNLKLLPLDLSISELANSLSTRLPINLQIVQQLRSSVGLAIVSREARILDVLKLLKALEYLY